MRVSKNNLWRFLHYVKPYQGHLILAVIGGVIKFTLPLLFPQITRHLIDHVFLNEQMSAEDKTRWLLLFTGGMIAVFLFFYAPWVYVRHYFAGKASHRAVFNLRHDLYYRILRLSASFFNRNKTGEIVSRLISDIALAQNLVGTALTNTWMDATSIIVVVFFLFRIDPATAAITLVIFPLYIFCFKKFRTEIRSTTSQIQDELATMAGNISETISASAVVHAFGREEKERRKFRRQSERLFVTNMRGIVVQSLNQTVTGTLTNIAPLIVIFFGGIRVVQGVMTVGELTAVIMYLGPLYLPMQRFSELNVVVANALAALDRIFQIMDEQPEIIESAEAVAPDTVAGEVVFQNVGFEYTENCPVLSDITFTVKPGQQVALVGPSGSGKTTIINLIPRFYDINHGSILIDGIDVRDFKIKALRQNIGMVLQDPILFSGSIYDNILYGNPNASDDQVCQAAQAANALEFIEQLPQGFQTDVGERGLLLSGGQKQRITIARAFLKDPAILILDEATSALDSESESLIQHALSKLLENRTTFVIAHRLSTVVHSDLILVLYAGEVVEQGTHDSLIQANGMYARFHRRQTHQDGPQLLGDAP